MGRVRVVCAFFPVRILGTSLARSHLILRASRHGYPGDRSSGDPDTRRRIPALPTDHQFLRAVVSEANSAGEDIMEASTLTAEQSIRQPKAAWYEPLVERDLVPDWILRAGIRRLVAQRLRDEDKSDPEKQQAHLMSYVEQLKASPIAIHTPDANQQHYEVPAEFFASVLGSHRKYSCCYWQEGDSLDSAERRMLDLTAERAQIEDGRSILERGCGWGAFSLYAASRFPKSPVTGVSNSNSQREFIAAQARERGLANLRIVTADIN